MTVELSLLVFDCAMRPIHDPARAAVAERIRLIIDVAGRLGISAHVIHLAGSDVAAGIPGLDRNSMRKISTETFDASQSDGLRALLNDGMKQFVVVGFEAHVALMQTVLGLLRNGAEVVVTTDAVAAGSADDWTASLNRMELCGASLASSEMMLFEWIGGPGHPLYGQIQRQSLEPPQSGAGDTSGVRHEHPERRARKGSASIGEHIRAARQELGLRLIDLSVIANCSTPHLSKIEGNKGRPSLPLLMRLCDALGKDIDWLLGVKPGGYHIPPRVEFHGKRIQNARGRT